MKRLAWAGLVLLAVWGAGAAWLRHGAPVSLAEARFLWAAQRLAAAPPDTIDLAQLYPGPWQTACDSGGYDGPLYLAQYGRSYEPVAPPQDGDWGLLLVQPDGSATGLVVSCRYPGITIDLNGCTSAQPLILKRRHRAGGQCPHFVRE